MRVLISSFGERFRNLREGILSTFSEEIASDYLVLYNEMIWKRSLKQINTLPQRGENHRQSHPKSQGGARSHGPHLRDHSGRQLHRQNAGDSPIHGRHRRHARPTGLRLRLPLRLPPRPRRHNSHSRRHIRHARTPQTTPANNRTMLDMLIVDTI